MTILDKQLQFSNAQLITVTAPSQNIVDLGPPGPNGWSAFGATGMDEVFVHIAFPTQFTAGGAGTLAISLQSSADEAFTTPVTHWTTTAIPLADLGPGDAGAAMKAIPMRIPYNVLRYVRLYYTVGTGPMLAGAITATGGAAPGTNIGYWPLA